MFMSNLIHGLFRPRNNPRTTQTKDNECRNYDYRESRDRGRNYAEQCGQLNLYRCGLSKKVIGVLHVFNMSDLDRIWAVSYLIAAMKETVDGIQYDKRDLEMKAQEVFDSHMRLFEGDTEACVAIEEAFIAMHGMMAKRINKSREEAGLPSLYETLPRGQAFRNPADSSEKDPKTGIEHGLGKDPKCESDEFLPPSKAKYCENVLRETGASEEYIRHVIEEDPELASYLCVNKTVSRGDDGVIRGALCIDGDNRGILFVIEDGLPLLIGEDWRPDAHATLDMARGVYGEQWKDAIMALWAARTPAGDNGRSV